MKRESGFTTIGRWRRCVEYSSSVGKRLGLRAKERMGRKNELSATRYSFSFSFLGGLGASRAGYRGRG